MEDNALSPSVTISSRSKPQSYSELSTSLKNFRSSQISTLHLIVQKGEEDSLAADSLREFLKKRSEIEIEYGKNLEKLAKSFSSKFVPKSKKKTTKSNLLNANDKQALYDSDANSSIESISTENSSEPNKKTTVQSFLEILLRETDRQAKTRCALGESLEMNTSMLIGANCETVVKNRYGIEFQTFGESFRDLVRKKPAMAKKIGDYLGKFFDIFTQAHYELLKNKKLYDDFEKESQNAKAKFDEVVRKPKGTFDSLLRNDPAVRLEKSRQKWKNATIVAQNAKNNYLISIEVLNELQTKFYNEDMPFILTALDGDYHEQFKDYCRKVLDSFNTAYAVDSESNEKLMKSCNEILRQADIDIFSSENKALLVAPALVQFDSFGSDENGPILSYDQMNSSSNGEILYQFMQKESICENIIKKTKKEIEGLNQIISTYQANPDFGNAASPQEGKVECELSLRLNQLEKRRYGVPVKIMTSVGVNPVIPETLPEQELSMAPLNVAKDTSILFIASALYDYVPQSKEEIGFKVGDKIKVISIEDGNWWKGIFQETDQIGIFPSNFVARVEDCLNTSHDNSICEDEKDDFIEIKKETHQDQFTNYFAVVKSIMAGSSSPLNQGDIVFVTCKGENEIISIKSIPRLTLLSCPSSQLKIERLSSKCRLVKALYDYEIRNQVEIPMAVHDYLFVFDDELEGDVNNDWLFGRNLSSGKEGEFPKAYVEEIEIS